MGGEGGVDVTVPAALQVLEENPDISLILVGDEHQIGSRVSVTKKSLPSRLEIVHADSCVSDDDKPENVLRRGKSSSMYVAAQLLKQGSVGAMVSAGNTGALLLIGRHLLKTIPGIQKPALVAAIPGASRKSYLLDVGANPDCNARQLFEFAVMGSVLAGSLTQRKATVGLLNIGSELHKGTEEVREAAGLMADCAAFEYTGFVEASRLFAGDTDVVVCDGFVGNVTIKSSAGVARVIKQTLNDEIGRSVWSRLAGLFSARTFKRLSAQINPQRFNGASLLGLQGSIVKSHGNATVEGFGYAIQQAVLEAEYDVPQLIAKKVAAIMEAH